VRLATDPRFAQVTSASSPSTNAKVVACPPTGSDAAAQSALWEATRNLSKRLLLPTHDTGYCLPGKAPLATILVVNK